MTKPTIKGLREQTGMTQKEFAEYFGINLRTLQGWERGKQPPEGMTGLIARIIHLETNQKEPPK